MMGHQSDGQDHLFYAFNLDDHVPPITCYVVSIIFSISAIFANT
jgi:hypothetical protein